MNEKYARWRMRYTLGCTNGTLCKIAHNIFCTLFFFASRFAFIANTLQYGHEMRKKMEKKILESNITLTSRRIRKVQCR